MPPGSLETSLRSSASSAATEIFVLAAICLSEIPRPSRAWRSFPPKSVIAALNLDIPRHQCQRIMQRGGHSSRIRRLREEADGSHARPAGAPHVGGTGG